MSQTKQPDRRDMERLSAYLDGMLDARETRKLEERLTTDTELRKQLAELRTTVLALRSLPDVRLPRSFTLTPEMAGVRSRGNPYLVMRAATVFAVLALVVTVGFDVLTRFSLGGAAPHAESVAMEMAEAPAAMDEVSGGMDDEAANVFAAEPEESMTEAMEESPAILEAEEVLEDPVRAQEGEVSDTIAETEVGAEEPQLTATPEPALAVDSSVDGAEEEGKATEATSEPTPEAADWVEPMPVDAAIPEDTPPAHGFPVIRVVEITLVVLSGLLAALTFWLRRR